MKKHTQVVAIAVITLLALLMRLFRLGQDVLWLDEALSWHFVTTRGISDIIFVLPQVDPHPPLYYVVLYYWTKIFGTSEFALRFPSVIFGVLAVPMVYLLTLRMFSHRIAIVSSAILAVAPFQIKYSQEARMYSLFVFLTIVSMYFLVTTFERGSRYDIFSYAISTVLLGYTHVYSFFIIAAQIFYLIIRRSGSASPDSVNIRRWVWIQTGVGVALLPWVILLVQRAVFQTESTISWLDPPGVESIPTALIVWVTGVGIHPVLLVLIPLTAVAILTHTITLFPVLEDRLSGLFDSTRIDFTQIIDIPSVQDRQYGYLTFYWTVLPIVFAFVISYWLQPIWHYRYTISVAIGFYIFVAKGVNLIGPIGVRYFLIFVLIIGFVVPLPAYYTSEEHTAWDDATAHIEEQGTDNDLVLISEPDRQVPFNYYWSDPNITVKTVADASDSGTENPDDEKHIQEKHERISPTAVKQVADNYDNVWLVDHDTLSSREQNIINSLATEKNRTKLVVYQDIKIYKFESEER